MIDGCKWIARSMSPTDTQRDVTEFDQFFTEDLTFQSSLLREAIQNSLDAALDGALGVVHVSFDLCTLTEPHEVKALSKSFSELVPHIKAADLSWSAIEKPGPIDVLVIEDFGTTGLTGSYKRSGNEPFESFWWGHGVSPKGGATKGRWGLGKLVFPASSNIRSFFGITRRHDDEKELLMGQSILKTHDIGEKRYKARVFWGQEDYLDRADHNEPYIVPNQNEEDIESIKQLLGLERARNSGLSIMIPYPRKEVVDMDSMLKEAIDNYVYPILTGRLQLEVSGTLLNASNIYEVAKKQWANDKSKIAMLDFMSIVKDMRGDPDKLRHLPKKWDGTSIDEDIFSVEELDAMREEYEDGRVLGFRIPFKVNKRIRTPEGRDESEKVESQFEVYIQRPAGLEKGRNYYIRNGLVITKGGNPTYSENAFGALIADDEGVSSFLGDAENPAHTHWIGTSTKLRKNYNSAATRLTYVRNSLIRIHALFSGDVKDVDEDALMDFFYTLEPQTSKKRGKKTPPKPVGIPKPRPKTFRLKQSKDGFKLVPGEGLIQDNLPMTIKIKAAYDLLSDEPLSRHDPLDFDFTKSNGLKIVERGVEVLNKGANSFDIEVVDPEFVFSVKGFDPIRDLLVKAVRENRSAS